MDINRLINMFLNIFMRKIMNKSIDAGMGYAARRGKTADQMTDAERAQAASAKDMAQRVKQVRNATRRFF